MRHMCYDWQGVFVSADAFVNSQEWTLSRTVPELKVVSDPDKPHTCFRNAALLTLSMPLSQGIVGNLASGKSALVHRYLTGTYVQEESPEGQNLNASICLSLRSGCVCFLVTDGKTSKLNQLCPRSPPLSKISSVK